MRTLNLIKVIDESERISEQGIDKLFELIEKEEKTVVRSIGISDYLREMYDDFNDEDDDENEFDFGNDGENEGDPELAASDRDDPDGMGDMDDMDDMEDPDDFDPDAQDPNRSKLDIDAFMSKYFGNEDEESSLYGQMRKPSQEFMARESLIQTITNQVSDLGGKKQPKLTPARHDFVITETDGTFEVSRIDRVGKDSVKVKVCESGEEKTIASGSILPALIAANKHFQKKAKDFKVSYPARNLWVNLK